MESFTKPNTKWLGNVYRLKEFMSAMQWSEFITNSVILTRIVQKKCKLNVPLAVGYLCNLEPHPQNCNLKHGYECEHKAPSMLLNPVHSAPSQACNVSQQRCRGGVPQNSGQLRRTARLISTEKRSPRMAENDKMLNSAKSAFCGSTSAISKKCGSTKKIKKVVLPQKILEASKIFCGSTVF